MGGRTAEAFASSFGWRMRYFTLNTLFLVLQAEEGQQRARVGTEHPWKNSFHAIALQSTISYRKDR